MAQNLPSMSLSDHLIELRKRLISVFIGFVIVFGLSYYYSEEIFAFLIQPLAKAFQNHAPRRLIYTGLTEAFVTYMKVAFFTAAFVSFPFLISQIWLFIAPGLYQREKKIVFPFLFAVPLFFIAGGAFAYYVILPPAWQFFINFESQGQVTPLPIELEARVGEYLSIVMQLLMAFGVCFQLPVALLLLARLGVIEANHLIRFRKYSFLGILCLSALLTPPDVLSMLGLAIPLYLLYEITILLIRWLQHKNK